VHAALGAPVLLTAAAVLALVVAPFADRRGIAP
jgi:hypothetical protein